MSGIHILIAIRVRFFYTRNRIRVSSACESTIIRYNYRYWCPACAVLFLNFHLNAVRVRAAIRTDLRGTQRPVHQWDSVNSPRFDARASVTTGDNLCERRRTQSGMFFSFSRRRLLDRFTKQIGRIAFCRTY